MQPQRFVVDASEVTSAQKVRTLSQNEKKFDNTPAMDFIWSLNPRLQVIKKHFSFLNLKKALTAIL